MDVDTLLARYDGSVAAVARAVRQILLAQLPSITEEPDATANVIGYGYESGYKGLICTLILSKKGVKVGFYKGAALPDPHHLLQGSGKVHRYVEIGSPEAAQDTRLAELIQTAADAYRTR